MNLTQGVHKILVVNFTVGLPLQCHQYFVGATERFHVLDERLHIFMLKRDHFGEPGLNRQETRHIAEADGDRYKQD